MSGLCTFAWCRLVCCWMGLMLGWAAAWAQPTAADQPVDAYHGPLANGEGKSLATRWPILLSHPFSHSAVSSFLGDQLRRDGAFDPYGVKKALESGGAVVYQPDKAAYGLHEIRGQLLYKKCEGPTLLDRLCLGRNPRTIDGVAQATVHYCANPQWRRRSGLDDEADCRQRLQFNVICHSQGCPDSRYMLAAVRQQFSGQLMYKHVASWTSLAGANKGTALADNYLRLSMSCLTRVCATPLLDLLLGTDGAFVNQRILPRAGDGIVALSRHYMLDSTDLRCTPKPGVTCPPSFNARYHLPVDAAHPILYQTFSTVIRDRRHPCFSGAMNLWHMALLDKEEGANDGYISLESQQFTTYGRNGTGGVTPVVARFIMGQSLDPARPHPGLNHMAFSDSKIPGMQQGHLSCGHEDNSIWRFSRVGVYRDVVAELVERGY